MEELVNILNCVGYIIMALGTVCIYDARRLISRIYKATDINDLITKTKIAGIVSFIIGGIIILN